MKKLIAFGFGLLAQSAVAFSATAPAANNAPADSSNETAAKALPAIPDGCADQIAGNGLYCSAKTIDGSKVNVTFIAVVNQDTYTSKPSTDGSVVKTPVENLLALYTDFAKWPDYVKASPEAVIEFKANTGSQKLPDLVQKSNDASVPDTVILRQTYDYNMKVQGIPLLKQAVSGITYNTIVKPYDSALASLEFAAQTAAVQDYPQGPKGMKSQVGSLHVATCAADICDASTQYMIVYNTVIEPQISFAMSIAADTVTAGIEDLLVGMLDEQFAPQ